LNQLLSGLLGVHPNETTISDHDALEIVAGAKRRLADDGCQVGAVRDSTLATGTLFKSTGSPR